MKSTPTRFSVIPCLLAFASGILLSTGIAAAQAHEVVAYAGRFDPANEDTPELGWELRLAPRRFRWLPGWLPEVSPIGGVMATSRGSLYTYGGFSTYVELSSRWGLTPSLAAGLYARQDGKDLGGELEFRSSLELGYQLSERSRLGLAVHHLSNSRLYRRNPGSESLVLAYVAKLGRKR